MQLQKAPAHFQDIMESPKARPEDLVMSEFLCHMCREVLGFCQQSLRVEDT